ACRRGSGRSSCIWGRGEPPRKSRGGWKFRRVQSNPIARGCSRNTMRTTWPNCCPISVRCPDEIRPMDEVIDNDPMPRTGSPEQAADAVRLLREYFHGAIMVDAESRITWIDERYRQLLKLDPAWDVLGLPVEQVIPHSRLGRVVETGQPILLDIMRFDDRQFVVCRIPLKGGAGVVRGAAGFVFYDNVDYLTPILEKFETLQKQLTRAQAALTRERLTKYS